MEERFIARFYYTGYSGISYDPYYESCVSEWNSYAEAKQAILREREDAGYDGVYEIVKKTIRKRIMAADEVLYKVVEKGEI